MGAHVTVYVPVEDCSACRQTKLRFEKLGVSFESVVADVGITERLHGEGFRAWPVVKVDLGEASWSWSGYRHDDIKRLAQLF